MRLLSNKLLDGGISIYHWCPGCNERHVIATGEAFQNGARWTWDGNAEMPTFSPSIHIQLGPWDDEDGHHPKYTSCHYFIRAGMIEFCGDSAHELAGKTVPLPDLPMHIIDRHQEPTS